MPNAHDETLIRQFIASPQRDRMLCLLSTRKGRKKVVESLAHPKAIRWELAEQVEDHRDQSEMVSRVLAELASLGASGSCYIMSENPDWDARTMTLNDAIREVVGSMQGTLVLCDPERIAYLETEEGRYILSASPG